MPRKIREFKQDAAGDWVAVLECGHTRHFRHDPPWQERPWVLSDSGREGFIGQEFECRDCGPA